MLNNRQNVGVLAYLKSLAVSLLLYACVNQLLELPAVGVIGKSSVANGLVLALLQF